jgi:hypothetical protein
MVRLREMVCGWGVRNSYSMASSKQSESGEGDVRGSEGGGLSPTGERGLGKAGERPVKRTEGRRMGGGSAGGSAEEADEEDGTSISTLCGLRSLPLGDGGGEGAMTL